VNFHSTLSNESSSHSQPFIRTLNSERSELNESERFFFLKFYILNFFFASINEGKKEQTTHNSLHLKYLSFVRELLFYKKTIFVILSKLTQIRTHTQPPTYGGNTQNFDCVIVVLLLLFLLLPNLWRSHTIKHSRE
jgi:hypothetical protein